MRKPSRAGRMCFRRSERSGDPSWNQIHSAFDGWLLMLRTSPQVVGRRPDFRSIAMQFLPCGMDDRDQQGRVHGLVCGVVRRQSPIAAGLPGRCYKAPGHRDQETMLGAVCAGWASSLATVRRVLGSRMTKLVRNFVVGKLLEQFEIRALRAGVDEDGPLATMPRRPGIGV